MEQLLQQLFDQARALWRFRWAGMAVAWTICILGWILVLFSPDTYEASAKVFVDTRTTLRQVTQGITIEADVETQLQRVRQALIGGPQLEKVAREAGIIGSSVTAEQRQLILARLRDNIDISTSLSTSHDNNASGTYVISYRDQSRDRSLQVVDRLLQDFVQSTLGGKREGSERAQKFLTDQIADYERRLSEAESKLASFKKENVGLMPGTQGDYFTRLQTEMDAANKSRASLGVALKRREELQRQLRGEQPVAPSTPNARKGPDAPANDTGAEIREAQARLDELLLRFTDKHPDVIALRQTLAELRAREQAEIEAMKRGDPGAAARLGLSVSPVYQSIQLQLNQTELEVTSLRAEVDDHERKIAELRQLMNSAPEVEAELARLNRDYDVTRAQYTSLVDRLERAKLSEEADQTGIVRFEVIDPPRAAFTPVAPDRPKLMIMILLAGIGAGAGVAYLLQQLRPVFSTTRRLNEVTGLPVLGAVTMIWLERHKVMERTGIFVFAGAAVLLISLSGVMVLVQGEATRLARSLLH